MKKTKHRIQKGSGQSLRNWERIKSPETKSMKADAFCEMGWGRLVFAHTFDANEKIVDAMCSQGRDTRDIAIYVIDPHVVVSMAPDRLFLDPSYTFRLWHHEFHDHGSGYDTPFVIQRVSSRKEAREINRIYSLCRMKGADPDFIAGRYATRQRTYMIARSLKDNRVIGTVSGVDHVAAFDDPENGASLWSLAVDPQADYPGVGIGLVKHLAAHYFTKGRAFVDTSVMHDNQMAINLYRKLGFKRIPAFCIKRKNTINEALFTPAVESISALNPYARIIVDEARRRGIFIQVDDADAGLFTLTLGGRSITCRESLSEMTSAVAMTRCDDKRLTRKLVEKEGIKVPDQMVYDTPEAAADFLTSAGRIVVKPARGEQGAGISVDISQEKEMTAAIEQAQSVCSEVLLESLATGDDLRVIVINQEVVAAALRKPPVITGTGRHSINALIQTYNRRRMAATDGESRIPVDEETRRNLNRQGFDLEDIPEKGVPILVRKTANLHTGGTIHDVTDTLSETIRSASVKIARILDIPVTGLDFIVPDVTGADYCFIEANERPGLANHEPQPTAQRFIDLLFPETVSSE